MGDREVRIHTFSVEFDPEVLDPEDRNGVRYADVMFTRHIKPRIKHNVTLQNGFSLLNLWLLLLWSVDGHEVRSGNYSIAEFSLLLTPLRCRKKR